MELDRFGGMIYLGENGQGIFRSKERSLYLEERNEAGIPGKTDDMVAAPFD